MRVRLSAVVLGCVIASGVPGLAQEPPPLTGEIHGRVVDQKALPLPGATVLIQRLGTTDALRIQAAAPEGTYNAPNLRSGIYRVEFSLPPAFQPLIHSGVVLLPGEKLELNASLRLAANTIETPPLKVEVARPGEVVVRLETSQGVIDLAIDTVRAPVTAANFLKYVDGGFYDGGRFHRATRPDNYKPAPPDRPMMEIIQGGINPDRQADGFPAIPLERTSVTGLKHVVGVVSMARGNTADTARSDFFILLDNQPSLDFGGKRFADGQGGAAFGRVLNGLEVVRKIQQQPVQAQSLTPPVPILKAYRVR